MKHKYYIARMLVHVDYYVHMHTNDSVPVQSVCYVRFREHPSHLPRIHIFYLHQTT